MASKKHNLHESSSKAGWDVFISHASEDKAGFVEPLAAALNEFGLKVWYDSFTLSLGDSLSRSIDEGLARSRFGLVVLSPSFIEKRWPDYELRGLTAREIAGGKIILPIWHNITHKELLRFSPTLADKLAVDSAGSTPLQISVKIIKQVRPELFERIARRRANLEMQRDAKLEYLDPRTIRSSPIQHLELTPDLGRRIRLFRASLHEVFPQTMDWWIDALKRDAHPSREVSFWEHLLIVLLEISASRPEMNSEQHKQLFVVIFMIGMGQDAENILATAGGLPVGILKEILLVYKSEFPIYEFPGSELRPRSKDTSIQEGSQVFWDTEHFPNDIPDTLVKKIIELERGDSSRG